MKPHLLTEKELIFGRWFGALIGFAVGGYAGWTVGFYMLMSWALRDSNTDQPGLGLYFYVTGAYGAIWGALLLGFLGFIISRKMLDWFSRSL